MQLVRKPHPSTDTQRDVEKELQLLYARRQAVDTLIASLQQYAQCHAGKGPHRDRTVALTASYLRNSL